MEWSRLPTNLRLESSLKIKYGETENWNFVNKTKRTDLLQNFCVSKLVERANKTTFIVIFNGLPRVGISHYQLHYQLLDCLLVDCKICRLTNLYIIEFVDSLNS